MKLQVLVIGIILLVIGGIIDAVGVAKFFGCNSFSSTCDFSSGTGLLVFGGVVFFVGIVVTIFGAVIGVAPHLKGLTLPKIPTPILRETVVAKEVLIQCRSCGARYPQGTLKCLTCGASL